MKARNNFSTDVVESDKFLEMSLEAQLAYFHLTANADSDGHIRSIRRVARSYGFSMDDVQELYDAGLFLDVEGECYVTHHWKNNGKDARWFAQTMERCVPYKSGLLKFADKEGNSAYVLNIPDESTIGRRLSDDNSTGGGRENDAALLGSASASASASASLDSSPALGWDGAEGKDDTSHNPVNETDATKQQERDEMPDGIPEDAKVGVRCECFVGGCKEEVKTFEWHNAHYKHCPVHGNKMYVDANGRRISQSQDQYRLGY